MSPCRGCRSQYRLGRRCVGRDRQAEALLLVGRLAEEAGERPGRLVAASRRRRHRPALRRTDRGLADLHERLVGDVRPDGERERGARRHRLGVRQRVNRHPGGLRQGVLEALFLVRQHEGDVLARRLRAGRRRHRRAGRPHGAQSLREDRHDAAGLKRIERLQRAIRGLLDRFELGPHGVAGEPHQSAEPGDRRVEAVEQAVLGCRRLHGARRQVHRRLVRAAPLNLSHPLRLVLAAPLHRDFEVGAAEQRLPVARLDREHRPLHRAGAEATLDVELPRLPGPQPLGDLLGELRGVAGVAVGERRNLTGHLVLAVAVGRRPAEARDQDERPEHSDVTDHVGEHVLLAPLLIRFGHRLREAEVVGSREQLAGAVERAGLQQFLRTDDAERVEQIRADDVLAALAARQRQISDPRVIVTRQRRDERRILVVGMGSRLDDARRGLQGLELLHQPGGAHAVDGLHLRVRAPHGQAGHDGQDHDRHGRDRRGPLHQACSRRTSCRSAVRCGRHGLTS